jgi:hypothetical protein
VEHVKQLTRSACVPEFRAVVWLSLSARLPLSHNSYNTTGGGTTSRCVSCSQYAQRRDVILFFFSFERKREGNTRVTKWILKNKITRKIKKTKIQSLTRLRPSEKKNIQRETAAPIQYFSFSILAKRMFLISFSLLAGEKRETREDFYDRNMT